MKNQALMTGLLQGFENGDQLVQYFGIKPVMPFPTGIKAQPQNLVFING